LGKINRVLEDIEGRRVGTSGERCMPCEHAAIGDEQLGGRPSRAIEDTDQVVACCKHLHGSIKVSTGKIVFTEATECVQDYRSVIGQVSRR
jgi:hypothetical protein